MDRIERLRRSLVGIALGALVAGSLIAAGTAHATMQLPFDGTSNFGFDNSTLMLTPDRMFDAESDPWLAAGNRMLAGSSSFSVIFDEVSTTNTLPGGQFEVLTTVTIENNSGVVQPLAAVFFAALAPGEPYDPLDVAVEIPDSELSIFRYVQSGSEFFFAGYEILDFQPGSAGAVTRSVRYVVDGSVINNRTPQVGAAAFFVPEPATGTLVALGLIVLAGMRRRAVGWW